MNIKSECRESRAPTSGRWFASTALACAFSLLLGCSRGEKPSNAPSPDSLQTVVDEPVTELRLAAPIEPLPPVSVSDDDWPWWRGREGNGVSAGCAPAPDWLEDRNVLWKAPLDGRGNSSPIVVESRVYLTESRNAPQREQSVAAFDATSGRRLWATAIHRDGFTENLHFKATYADPTLACDGERLFAVFLHQASIVVTALTLDGEIAWQTKAGRFRTHSYGYGASPVLFESFVIVVVDDPDGGSISALHRKTGEVMWRTRRPPGESYASPVVAHVAGRPQLLINGKKLVASYDPATGELLWSHDSPALVACNTMTFDESHVFASGGMPDKQTACFRAAVDVDGPRLVWKNTRPPSTCYVPSLILSDGRLFNLNDDGVLTCFAADNGNELFKKRFAGAFSASPVIADGRLIIVNEEGKAWVLQTAPPFDVVSENSIEPGVMATPALCRGRIYLRTAASLYCIRAER